MEQRWKDTDGGKGEVLAEKPVLVALCLPRTPHARTVGMSSELNFERPASERLKSRHGLVCIYFVNLFTYLLTYLFTYLLTYLLHGAGSFLRS